MNTLILNSDTASLSIGHLLKQVDRGGVEVRDTLGNVIAFVVSPADHQAWTYAEGHFDLDQHREQVERALRRRGGVSTSQLLQKAVVASQQATQQ